MRSLVGAKEHDTAVALAESLRAQPQTAELGRLAGGIAAARRGYRELAWEELRGAPAHDLGRPRARGVRPLRAGRSRPRRRCGEVRALAADDPPEVRAKSWHELLAAVWGHGESELARELFAIFERQRATTARCGAPRSCTATGCGPGSRRTRTRRPRPRPPAGGGRSR